MPLYPDISILRFIRQAEQARELLDFAQSKNLRLIVGENNPNVAPDVQDTVRVTNEHDCRRLSVHGAITVIGDSPEAALKLVRALAKFHITYLYEEERKAYRNSCLAIPLGSTFLRSALKAVFLETSRSLSACTGDHLRRTPEQVAAYQDAVEARVKNQLRNVLRNVLGDNEFECTPDACIEAGLRMAHEDNTVSHQHFLSTVNCRSPW